MATIVAYVLTIAAVILTLTALVQTILGGLLGQMLGPLLGALVGGLIVWGGVEILWLWLEGGHVPIAALAGALAILFAHSAIAREQLTEQSNWMMAGEAWAIVLLGIYLVIFPESIRWY